VRGDLVDDLPALAAQAPASATLVVFHTSVMYQVPAPRREAFAEVVRGLPGHWIANEAPDVLPYDALPEPPGAALHNVLRWTEHRLPGPAHTGRRSSGSRNVRAPNRPLTGRGDPHAGGNHPAPTQPARSASTTIFGPRSR